VRRVAEDELGEEEEEEIEAIIISQ